MISFCSILSPEWQPSPKQIWFGQNKVSESLPLWEGNSVNKHPHPVNRIEELNIPGFLWNILSHNHKKYSSFPHHFHKRPSPSSQRMRQKCDKNRQCLCLNDRTQHMSTELWRTEGSLEQAILGQHHSWNWLAAHCSKEQNVLRKKQHVPRDVSPKIFGPIYGSVRPAFALWGSFIT